MYVQDNLDRCLYRRLIYKYAIVFHFNLDRRFWLSPFLDTWSYALGLARLKSIL